MNKKLKVLVVGSGGREHTLAWKLAQSPWLIKIYCAPGNGGICQTAQCVSIKADDLQGLLQFVKSEAIDFTVVGPEAPLVAGIVDVFRENGLAIFGPSRAAARLEGSKIFSKELMKKYSIPTAAFEIFSDAGEAKAYLKKAPYPLVVKADGLAAGKGVVVAANAKEAGAAIDDIMVRKVHGEAGNRVVIEECLTGPEASVLALVDGKDIAVLPPAQDHKRIFDGDRGPNTGGMGAYSPTPLLNAAALSAVRRDILERTVAAMAQEGCPFQGVLYAGLMLTKKGPRVLEFNARFGDPETQVILPRLQGDLLEILWECAHGRLAAVNVACSPGAAVCVVIAAGGYPGSYEKDKLILGLERAQKIPGVTVFHAGTRQDNGAVKTAGGRVLGITALRPTLQEAVARAYQAADLVCFEGVQFRRDIAQKALAVQ